MPVTILQVAKARATNKGLPDPHTGQDFDDLGLDIMGGCQGCHASIACYNAYPSKSGYWQCAECVEMSGRGFDTVEEFEEWSEEEVRRDQFVEEESETRKAEAIDDHDQEE